MTAREQRLAARFAAKEAFLKAWSGARAGRAPALESVDLREIEVVDDGHGRPALALHGAVAAALAELAAERGRRDPRAPLAEPRPADGGGRRRAQRALSRTIIRTAASVVVLSAR